MRFLRLIPAVVVLFFTGAAYSQEWSEYVNRENFFHRQFPRRADDDPSPV